MSVKQRRQRCIDALTVLDVLLEPEVIEDVVERVLDAWQASNPAEAAYDYQQAGVAVRASRRVDV